MHRAEPKAHQRRTHMMRPWLRKRHQRVTTHVQQTPGLSDQQPLWLTLLKGIVVGVLPDAVILNTSGHFLKHRETSSPMTARHCEALHC